MFLTTQVLFWMTSNIHVGPMERELTFLIEAGLNPLTFLQDLAKLSLVKCHTGQYFGQDDKIGTFHFRITEKGKKFLVILNRLEKIDPSMKNASR